MLRNLAQAKVLVAVGAGRKGKRGRRRDEAGCPGEASGRQAEGGVVGARR